MKFPQFVGVAVLAAAVATGVAACGDDSSDDVPTVPSTTSAAASAESGGSAGVTNATAPPSVAVLNEMLSTALDPAVPNSKKTELVQDSEKDLALFDKLVAARKQNPGVTYKILPPVIPAGPNKATVKVQVKLPDNPPAKADAQIVYSGGRWKLSANTVCGLLGGANIKSPMCPS
ncbi:MAG: hypothetical protein QM673_04415 [Gordonia sp. (in: high G+C Gram-positive bacteria)]